MPRPTTKTELLTSVNTQFEKLWKVIDSMNEDEKTADFCFEISEKDFRRLQQAK